MGPIEAKLLDYGALDGPDAHAVVGLVLGAFGELSTSCSVHVHRAGGGGQALGLLENEPGAGTGLLQAEDFSLLEAHRAAGLGSPHTGPPPRPRFVPRRFQGQFARPGHGRARTPQFFFLDDGHGAANGAGFGWRNGG